MPQTPVEETKAEALHWIQENGSGTLRRAQEEGLIWFELYVHERLAFEVATMACAVPQDCIKFSDMLAQGDSPATTESCWFARVLRYRFKNAFTITVKSFALKNDEMNQMKILQWPFASGVCLHFDGIELSWADFSSFYIVVPIAFWDDMNNKYTEVLNPC